MVAGGAFNSWSRSQSRVLLAKAKMAKATMMPAAISIQFWASKPKIVKCPVRNSTAPVPFLCKLGALDEEIYYLCIGDGGLGTVAPWPAWAARGGVERPRERRPRCVEPPGKESTCLEA